MSQQPNVLFILSDQHNAKVLGHKGHPDVLTPNLDRMAAEGVRFENAITQNSICTPSRVSYLSGQYCHNHGYYGLSGPNPGGLPTLLGHFRRAGYITAAIGKIHCPEYWVEDDSDLFLETSGRCSIGGSPTYQAYLEAEGLTEAYQKEVAAKSPTGGQLLDGFPTTMPYRATFEGWVASRAMGFMEHALAAGRPFFVHASVPKPHQVYCPAQPFWDLYETENLTLPPNADYEMVHQAPHLARTAERYRDGAWTVFEPKTFEAGRMRKLHGYLGAVSQVDHAVGEMLDFIREKGAAENTIVVYGSDHGDYACEHGIMEKAPGICHDAITRVPYIWHWPGHLEAGHVAHEVVEAVDLSTTLCALAGMETMETSDGVDISHLLRGERGEVHRIGVTEFAWSKSVRMGQYRCVYYPPQMFPEEYPGGFGELYDLEGDPWEMHNLYFEPAYQDVISEMRTELLNWLITTTRPRTVNRANSGGRPIMGNNAQRIVRYRTTVNADGKIHPDNLKDIAGSNYL